MEGVGEGEDEVASDGRGEHRVRLVGRRERKVDELEEPGQLRVSRHRVRLDARSVEPSGPSQELEAPFGCER